MVKARAIDKLFLISIVALTVGGFFIFASASLGVLTRGESYFGSIIASQAGGLCLGILFFYIFSKIPYKFWRKMAFWVLFLAFLINSLIFIPSLSFSHGGAVRWLDLGFITFQTSELLKIAFIIYFSAWLAKVKDKSGTWKKGFLPLFIILSVIGLFLLAQSDTDTLAVIGFTGITMLFIANGKWSHLFSFVTIGLIAISLIVFIRPYAKERIMTFFDPERDPQGASYQINQSLIAVGSGYIFGRGLGQSVQKFGYLPEPTGDSIFSVWAEEFGFVGSVILIMFYLFFLSQSFKIATRCGDLFGGLLVSGIAILIIVESFLNISSMIGVIPLSGMPLLFVSKGGSALLMVLTVSGIIGNISRYRTLS